jgi:hypothetical protein
VTTLLRLLAPLALAAPLHALPPGVPAEPFSQVKEYGFMNWANGLNAPDLRIQTSRYLLHYNPRSFGPTSLTPLANPPTEAEALTVHLPPGPPLAFSCTAGGNGTTGPVTAVSEDLRTCQLVESGKFFQRRWQSAALPAGIPFDPARTGLETAAWPDRLSFVLRLTPTADVKSGTLSMTLDLPDAYQLLPGEGPVRALVAADGSGFVVLPSSRTDALSLDEKTATLTATKTPTDWKPGQEVSLGIILHPAARGIPELLARILSDETSPLTVTATGIEPALPQLPVTHDKDPGFHRVILPKGSEGDDGRMRARITVKNPHPEARVLRLCFDGVPHYIPGLTAVLRDLDGFPLGIPVQLSKNWHGPNPPADGPAGFAGYWFHGLTMLAVPPNSTWEFELMMTGENWGGIAAATHSQLSIIGYGGNQQWDEAALGNRGEALCYDMDHVLTDNDFTDSRPFHAIDTKGKRNWGINAGGGSVLRYTDAAGTVRRHASMRVRYLRYCPVLTEAIFAGRTDDGAMDFRFSAGLPRADDATRGLHRIRIDMKKDTPFRRLVFYQQAGDTYSYNQGDTLSFGHAGQPTPIRQWKASGKPGEITGEAIALEGPSPWAAVTHGGLEKEYRPANHGFIIRSWKARLDGREVPLPYLQERRNAANVSILELVPPPGLTQLKAGDFVEIDLVRLYVPRSLDNYGGKNEPFRQALRDYDNDPRMILREAAGNNLTITPTTGTLERLHPPQIRAASNRATFTLRGGLGAVPVTFTGLTDYRYPVLEQKVGDTWQKIDQSVAGNDFWQCDFNAATGTWEITFTILPDGPYQNVESLIQEPRTREFRFQVGGPSKPAR